MLEKIQHIKPNEIKDLAEMQNLLVLMMNIVENQAQQIASLASENQELRNEINRLKGEHGDLPPTPPKSSDGTVSSKEQGKKRQQKNHKKGPKKAKIEIDQTVKGVIDKEQLPEDATFQGYRKVIQQDILFKRNNTCFLIPIYYSKSQQRTYSGDLPIPYEGEFGGQLKSFLQLMHHYCDVTQGRLKTLMDNLGILISTGSISHIILSNQQQMEAESRAILKAGIEHIPYTQMDGTKSWEAGQGKATQIISTPYYSVYHTMKTKSKADIIWALQGKIGNSTPLMYNDLAEQMLQASNFPKKDQVVLSALVQSNPVHELKDLEALLKEKAEHLLQKATYPKMIEILALAYYFTQTDCAKVQRLLSDAGPEYIGIAPHQALCWLHEERHYKKMIPALNLHQQQLDQVRGQIWDFYEQLLNFKELPADQQSLQKQGLLQQFDTIFTQQTTYEHLNERLKKTFEKKEKLLQVLDFPFLPLHNNCAELAVRRKVRKRDISLHTMSSKGTSTQDAFMSVVETAAKLGVNALDYLYDRITEKFQMTSLADLICQITI